MCGIVGIVDPDRKLCNLVNTLERMTASLVHRGPDDQGLWLDHDGRIGLGHRRLSIIDLSEEGHQPMISSSGRFVISFNGEIYNFPVLRAELEALGYKFRGHSDTEVMLAAIEAWGLERAIRRFIGMFVFALWDHQERALSLVRDRIGIKPVYYGIIDNVFVFGSELKAIRVVPGFDSNADRRAVTLLLQHGYIPNPFSVYRQVEKLQPGHILRVDEGRCREVRIRSFCYWSVREVTEGGERSPFSGDAKEAILELERLLQDAVRLRMIADVPLGAFLSGGIDSTTVAALMQHQSTMAIRTFSIGFDDCTFNEAQEAKRIARYLGTEHTEFYVTVQDAIDLIPKLPIIFDEPFADPSAIPTYLVSRLAKQHVTVALSGDGGDELFYGYSRYFDAVRRWRLLSQLPHQLRTAIGSALERANNGAQSYWLEKVLQVLSGNRATRSGTTTMKLATMLAIERPDELFCWISAHWKEPEKVVLRSEPAVYSFERLMKESNLSKFEGRMSYLDLITYLPDDILTKVDRASMSVSLEARVPLLDHRIVEFSAAVPMGMKCNPHGMGKWILKQVLYKYVPKELIERPKKGFGVPIGAWLRGPLRDWAEDLLSEEKLSEQGYFDAAKVREVWREHIEERRNNEYMLWSVLMFQGWLAHYA